MVIVLRFVDKDGYVQERFFDIVHVANTSSLTLKKEICTVLSYHNLSVKNIRGQGYDGASNMRGEWSGLQALFLAECPYDYYIHCFAHRLQLALVAASKEVTEVGQFFSNLGLAVNIPNSSCKRHDQMRAVRAANIAHELAINEDELDDESDVEKNKNRSETLKRACDTRWGSHLGSITSLINLYDESCIVINNVIEDGTTASQRAEAKGVYDNITTFEFVFILHLMQELLEISDDLFQALQRKSQDILNAMHVVSTTKGLVQKFRDDGWDPLFEKVKLFAEKHGIKIPVMSDSYNGGKGRSRTPRDITNEHYPRVKIFIRAVDSQRVELNERFKEDVIELLIFSSALDPRDRYKSFRIDYICDLVNKYYPMDFSVQEKLHLKYQLQFTNVISS